MKILTQPIGILGGTFDPIHLGHIQIGLNIVQDLPIETIKYLPCGQPAHRELPCATKEQRATMVQLAIQPYPQFSLDQRELLRDGKSFMIDTLISLRQDNPQSPLCLILGADAYQHLENWRQWQELLNYAHFVIISRPGYEPGYHPHPLLMQHETANFQDIQSHLAGYIYFYPNSACSISATEVRSRISNDENLSDLLPAAVIDYIKEHGIYQNTVY